MGSSGGTLPCGSKLVNLGVFWGQQLQGVCLVGANTFRSGPHPKWVPMGPKSITKKNLTSSDTPNPSYVQLSPPKKATYRPCGEKGLIIYPGCLVIGTPPPSGSGGGCTWEPKILWTSVEVLPRSCVWGGGQNFVQEIEPEIHPPPRLEAHFGQI